MKTILSVTGACIALFALGAFATPMQDVTNSAPGQATAEKALIAGYNFNDRPNQFLDNSGNPAGFDVALLQAVAAAAGVKIQFKTGSLDEITEDLRSGRITMLAGVHQNTTLSRYADFCTPFLLIQYSIFTKKGSPITTEDDLAGRRIIARNGDSMTDRLATIGISGKLTLVDTTSEALHLLMFGNYDCALLPTELGERQLQKQRLFEKVDRHDSANLRSRYGFVVRRGDTELLKSLETGLSAVKSSGMYGVLDRKWLKDYLAEKSLASRYAIPTAILILVAILIVLTWSRSLKLLVASRTTALEKTIRGLKDTENSLTSDKQSLIALLRSAPYGIVVLADWNWDSDVIYANRAFVEMFGFQMEEAPTLAVLFENVCPEKEYRSRIHQRWKKLGEGGTPEGGFIMSIKPRDGETRRVDFQAAPIGDGRIIVMFSDVTERQVLEEERQRLDEQIRQSQKLESMGQLAGGVSHDFNNLLTPILGNAQLLLLALGKDHAQSPLLQDIIGAARRAGELTKQLLAYARKGKFQIVPVDVHQSIREAISLLQRSIDKLIEIRQDFLASRPVVMGDPSQIQGALINLGVNARDAMPNGGKLTFSTRMVDVDKETCRRRSYDISPGEYLEISVGDTGIGIPREVRQRLFEPFFTTKKPGQGTGLGLAAVYGCVKNHHGTIEVESEHGKGTTFRILLPAVGRQIEDEERFEGDLARGHGHILIVDDEETVRKFMTMTLEELGYVVSACSDGAQAVEFYKDHHEKIDLVILDLIMPNMDGKTAFELMKEINPTVRVFVASGYAADQTAVECMQQGALAFLAKPYDIEELAKTVSIHIRRRPVTSSAG